MIRLEGPLEKKLLANKEMNLVENVEKFVEILKIDVEFSSG
jgi:hypothetical protein